MGGKYVVIVEGRFTRFGVGNDLLVNAKSVVRILCPETNAFARYEEILKFCLKQEKEVLFLLSLGPTATVLAEELSINGYQAIDLGHLDIEYEWFLRGSKKKTKVKNKYVNETDDIISETVDNFFDAEYEKSIIYRIY